MAYDKYLAERINRILQEKYIPFFTKNMMGGLCYMMDDKMLCGLMFNKKHNMELLMARIGESAYDNAMKKNGCMPMDFTGRPMKGYVFVAPTGFDTDEDLGYWLNLCIDFNPLAKSSKKKQGLL